MPSRDDARDATRATTRTRTKNTKKYALALARTVITSHGPVEVRRRLRARVPHLPVARARARDRGASRLGRGSREGDAARGDLGRHRGGDHFVRTGACGGVK